jgi:hypothetical protein
MIRSMPNSNLHADRRCFCRKFRSLRRSERLVLWKRRLIVYSVKSYRLTNGLSRSSSKTKVLEKQTVKSGPTRTKSKRHEHNVTWISVNGVCIFRDRSRKRTTRWDSFASSSKSSGIALLKWWNRKIRNLRKYWSKIRPKLKRKIVKNLKHSPQTSWACGIGR